MTTIQTARRPFLAHPNTLALLRFVGLALFTGVLSAFTLMLLVLLVSGNANAQTVYVNHEVQRGELLLADENGQRTAAPLVSTTVEAQLNGMIGRIKVVQTFINPSDRLREAIYAFPLPENSAVDHMSVRIGERLIEGQIKEKAQARKIYEQAKSEGKRAALVEQFRPNLFTTSVAPIRAKETVVVSIEYQQSLRYDQGNFSWRFPLAITPRYTPPTAGDPGMPIEINEVAPAPATPAPQRTALSEPALKEVPVAVDGAGHALTTRNRAEITVTLAPGAPIDKVVSAYHAVQMQQLGNGRYQLTLKNGQVATDRDFELSWTPKTGSAPQSTLYSETVNGENYYYLMLLPEQLATTQQRTAREITYIIDTSGSMSGEPMRQAKEAMLTAVKRLAPGDFFNIIEFNSSMTSLFSEPLPFSFETQQKALRFVNSLDASGGTEMYPALQAALTAPRQKGVIGQVVFLTDGAVGNEEQLFGLIESQLGDRRLFTVGIGSAPNAYFMNKAAEFGRGTFTFIGNMNEVQSKMAELFGKIETPSLTDIKAEWSAQVDMAPAVIGDLYKGEPVVVVAKAANDLHNGVLKLSGKRGNAEWNANMNIAKAVPAAGVATLWAREKIDQLLNEGRQAGDVEAQREAIVKLALNHHLVSRFTSLVAVDVTPIINEGEKLDSAAVPQTLPNGMNPRMAGMASTATPAGLSALIGMLLMAIALVMAWVRRSFRSNLSPWH